MVDVFVLVDFSTPLISYSGHSGPVSSLIGRVVDSIS